MPELRHAKMRETLPQGYQFGDAVRLTEPQYWLHPPEDASHEHAWVEITQMQDRKRKFMCMSCPCEREEDFEPGDLRHFWLPDEEIVKRRYAAMLRRELPEQ